MSSTLLDPPQVLPRGADPAAVPQESALGRFSGLKAMPAWLMSLLVHGAVLLMLASWTTMILPESDPPPITSIIEDVDERDFKFEDATVVDQVGTETDTQLLTSAAAMAQRTGDNPQERMQEKMEEVSLVIETKPLISIPEPNEADLISAVDVRGPAAEHPGGVEGAIDLLTFEIQNSLRERKTLVVWLFDESDSMKERREAVADRMENVYRQLGLLNDNKDLGDALLSAVVGFNKAPTFYTSSPVTEVKEAIDHIRTIKRAESPLENVFTAVAAIVQKYKSYRTRSRDERRNVMIVIVTDERGDDYQMLERVIDETRKYGMRVYCVGNSAVFGREKGYIRWVYEDGFVENLPVDQGPETVAPESLNLDFWGGRAQELQQMSAGVGPYALTRLCAETRGMYLVAKEVEGPKFDLAVMRDYLPDYRPIKIYQQDLSRYASKAALVRAATMTVDDPLPRPDLQFRADTDTALRQEVTEAQKPLAVLDYRLAEIHQVLESGVKDADKLREPRWRAGFDLAMGRILAMRARAYGYNAILAQMKASPKSFEKEGNNTWVLEPSTEIHAGADVKKLVRTAEEYLSRVVDNHPGTPWALVAQQELNLPLGWQWRETKRDYTSTAMANNRRTIQLIEEVDPATGKKRTVERPRKRPNL